MPPSFQTSCSMPSPEASSPSPEQLGTVSPKLEAGPPEPQKHPRRCRPESFGCGEPQKQPTCQVLPARPVGPDGRQAGERLSAQGLVELRARLETWRSRALSSPACHVCPWLLLPRSREDGVSALPCCAFNESHCTCGEKASLPPMPGPCTQSITQTSPTSATRGLSSLPADLFLGSRVTSHCTGFIGATGRLSPAVGMSCCAPGVLWG